MITSRMYNFIYMRYYSFNSLFFKVSINTYDIQHDVLNYMYAMEWLYALPYILIHCDKNT